MVVAAFRYVSTAGSKDVIAPAPLPSIVRRFEVWARAGNSPGPICTVSPSSTLGRLKVCCTVAHGASCVHGFASLPPAAGVATYQSAASAGPAPRRKAAAAARGPLRRTPGKAAPLPAARGPDPLAPKGPGRIDRVLGCEIRARTAAHDGVRRRILVA